VSEPGSPAAVRRADDAERRSPLPRKGRGAGRTEGMRRTEVNEFGLPGAARVQKRAGTWNERSSLMRKSRAIRVPEVRAWLA